MTRLARSRSLVLGGLAAAALVALAVQTVRAFNPQPDPPGIWFGMTGLTRGQTARISVANLTPPDPITPADSITPPDPLAPPDPCRVMLAFVDANGDALMYPDGRPVRRSVRLPAGRSAFLQINGDEFVGGPIGDVAGAARLDIRPVVLIAQRSDRGHPPDPCAPTLEMIDNATARTTFVSPGVAVGNGFNHNETLVRDEGR